MSRSVRNPLRRMKLFSLAVPRGEVGHVIRARLMLWPNLSCDLSRCVLQATARSGRLNNMSVVPFVSTSEPHRSGLATFLAVGTVALYVLDPNCIQSGNDVHHTLFKIDAWGVPVGDGLSGAIYCTISGVAKRNSPDSPYAVPNEYICGRLGYTLGLPVPPGVVVQTDEHQLAYVSLKFGANAERPPSIIPPEFVSDNARLAAGVVAFDTWIANLDRHEDNLTYSRFGTSPVVFDHDRALFGAEPEGAVDRLTRFLDEGLAGSCISQHLPDDAELDLVTWSDRIRNISHLQIRDICQHMVCDGGINQDTCEAAVRFLSHRKDRMAELLRSSADEMPKVRRWWLK